MITSFVIILFIRFYEHAGSQIELFTCRASPHQKTNTLSKPGQLCMSMVISILPSAIPLQYYQFGRHGSMAGAVPRRAR